MVLTELLKFLIYVENLLNLTQKNLDEIKANQDGTNARLTVVETKQDDKKRKREEIKVRQIFWSCSVFSNSRIKFTKIVCPLLTIPEE